MDVPMTVLRACLRSYRQRVQDDEPLAVAERGVPVGQALGAGRASLLESLIEQGVVTAPTRPDRPLARGRRRVKARRSVADVVAEQRG